jgi:hypothetical protein
MIFIAVTAWFALILQLYIIIKNGLSAGIHPLVAISNFFSYFTILSNFVVAISLTAGLLASSSAAGKFFTNVSVRTAIAVYIFIVGLVYNLVLRKIWSPTGWQLVADNLLHVLVPLFYVLFWYFFIPRNMLKWNDIFPWLLFPACYLVYSLVRGASTGWYPYPFLHAGELGYAKVAVNSLVVLLAFVAVGLGMIGINRIAKRIPDSKS